MFIDGKWTNAHNQETFASYNPANAELLGQVPSGGKKDALAAIDSASTAFPSWSSLTAYQRSKFLICLLYTSPSPRDLSTSRMPSSA